jgi:hypothetical protein
VTVGHEFADRARREADTVFMVLDLAGYTDQHLDLSLVEQMLDPRTDRLGIEARTAGAGT